MINARRYAILSLGVFALDKFFISLLNIFREGISVPVRVFSLNALTAIFNWLIPLAIVYRVERRGKDSLGLSLQREKLQLYILFGIIALGVPAVYFGLDRNLIIEFMEQILFIGLAEEFFYRGYIMTRLCDWLGDSIGLIMNALVFSLAHIIFIVTNEGFRYPWFLASTGFQTFLGGLLLGYIYLKSGDILPSSILHVSLNVYLSKL